MQRPLTSNPPNPFGQSATAWDADVPPPPADLEVTEDRSRSILSENQSPDVPFRWSANPYRGCQHACAYCYARPTHEKLGLGAGTDFDTRLLVKPDAARLLREAFERPGWRGERVAFSGVTDCYQPLEARYGLTRACLEVCLEYRNPVAIITKNALVERDADLLAALDRAAQAPVTLSLTFADPERSRALEPHAPSPARRLEAVRRLAEAGVPVGVYVAPLIPGLNDEEVPAILAAARAAGARFAGGILLRLPGSVAQVFEERLRAAFPDRAERVLAAIRDCRDGHLTDPRFGHRMRGHGPRYEAIRALFDLSRRRLGFEPHPREPDPSPFRRPGRAVQGTLF